MKKQIGIVVLTLLLGLGMTAGKAKAANVGSNESWDQASMIDIDRSGSSSFNHKSDEAHYFKFKAPSEEKEPSKGMPWIQITLTNQLDESVYMDLLDSSGASIQSGDYIGPQGNGSFFTKVQDTGITVNGNGKTLTAGNVYGIRVKTMNRWSAKGNVSVSIKRIDDDVWGTAEKAKPLEKDVEKKGTLEVSNDLDYYAVTLPNDGKQYQFRVKTDNGSVKAKLEDENVQDITVAPNTKGSMEETGNGQKVYVRIEPDGVGENDDISEINRTYHITVTEKKGNATAKKSNTQNKAQSTTGNHGKIPGWFPKITCKKGAKVITGKLSDRCTLNVKVGGKTYIRSTSMTGKFQIKLKKQLKAGTKVKVKVWSRKHGTKTKTFRIK